MHPATHLPTSMSLPISCCLPLPAIDPFPIASLAYCLCLARSPLCFHCALPLSLCSLLSLSLSPSLFLSALYSQTTSRHQQAFPWAAAWAARTSSFRSGSWPSCVCSYSAGWVMLSCKSSQKTTLERPQPRRRGPAKATRAKRAEGQTDRDAPPLRIVALDPPPPLSPISSLHSPASSSSSFSSSFTFSLFLSPLQILLLPGALTRCMFAPLLPRVSSGAPIFSVP